MFQWIIRIVNAFLTNIFPFLSFCLYYHRMPLINQGCVFLPTKTTENLVPNETLLEYHSPHNHTDDTETVTQLGHLSGWCRNLHIVAACCALPYYTQQATTTIFTVHPAEVQIHNGSILQFFPY